MKTFAFLSLLATLAAAAPAAVEGSEATAALTKRQFALPAPPPADANVVITRRTSSCINSDLTVQSGPGISPDSASKSCGISLSVKSSTKYKFRPVVQKVPLPLSVDVQSGVTGWWLCQYYIGVNGYLSKQTSWNGPTIQSPSGDVANSEFEPEWSSCGGSDIVGITNWIRVWGEGAGVSTVTIPAADLTAIYNNIGDWLEWAQC